MEVKGDRLTEYRTIQKAIYPSTHKKRTPFRDALHCSSYSTERYAQSPRLNLSQLMHLSFQLGK